MTRQLSTMVSSGMSLLRALYVLEDQAESDKLKETLVAVRKDVEAGISLSDALAKHPETFNELYTAMVAAGETGGILENTLRASPTSSRRTRSCGARSSRRWSTRR